MDHTEQDLLGGDAAPSAKRRAFLGLAGVAAGIGVLASAGTATPAAAAPADGAIYDVTELGAKGDGSSDDSPAFTAAFDAIREAGGGCVIVPPGEYWLSPKTGGPALVLPSNLTMIGYGATLTRARGVLFSVTSPGRTGYGSGAKNITVRGFTVRGNYAEARPIAPFSFHHASDVSIIDCAFIECQGSRHCIDLGACERVLIQRCRFEGFNNDEGPGYAPAECIQVDYSYNGATSVSEPAGSFDGLMSRDITVDDCSFLPLTVGGTTYPCPNPLGCHGYKEDSWMERIRFTGNLVVDPGAQVVSDDGPNQNVHWGVVHLPGCADVLIADNRFIQTTDRMARVLTFVAPNVVIPTSWDPNRPQPEKITLDGGIGSKRIRILRNTFTGFRRTATDVPGQQVIWLRGLPGGGEITDIVIADNTFDDLFGPDDDRYAILANYADDLEIRDNTFGKAHAGIRTATCRRVRVSGNTFSGVDALCIDLATVTTGSVAANTSLGGSPTGLVRVNTLCAQVSVTGNSGADLAPPKDGAAIIAGAAGFTVTGNVLTGRGTVGIRVPSGGTGTVTGNSVTGFDTDVTPRRNGSVVVTGNA